jgi:ABC-type phosphate transport system substrate-binding protein
VYLHSPSDVIFSGAVCFPALSDFSADYMDQTGLQSRLQSNGSVRGVTAVLAQGIAVWQVDFGFSRQMDTAWAQGS